MSKYAIVYERAGDGTWSAMIPDLPGVWSIGSTIRKARNAWTAPKAGWNFAEQGASSQTGFVEEVSITCRGRSWRALVARIETERRTRSR